MQLPAYLMNEARAARDASIVREGWDVSGAYYRSDPRKIIYVYAPPGYDRSKESGDRLVWRLKKSLPGTTDAGRNWYTTFSKFLTDKIGMRSNKADAASLELERGDNWVSIH